MGKQLQSIDYEFISRAKNKTILENWFQFPVFYFHFLWKTELLSFTWTLLILKRTSHMLKLRKLVSIH